MSGSGSDPPGVDRKKKALTGPLRWTRAVARAPLRSSLKLVLYALADHLSFSDWLVWTGKPELLVATGLRSRRTLDAAFFDLVSLGVLEIRHASRGGIGSNGRGLTSTYWANIAKLEQMNPATNAGLNPAIHDNQPRKSRLRTRQPLPGNRPSIHNTPDEQTIHAKGARPMEGNARQVGWMDGQNREETDVRGLLSRLGVQGPNLDAIVTVPEITVAVVREVYGLIAKDPRVRKKAAVLVTRLNKRFALGLPGRTSAPAAHLKAADNLNRLRAKNAARDAKPAPLASMVSGLMDKVVTSESSAPSPSLPPTSKR